jgi:hypothetical protein
MILRKVLCLPALVLISGLVSNAHAVGFNLTSEEQVQNDFQAQAGKSRYQTLLDAYNGASKSADIAYFEQNTFKKCTTVKNSADDATSYTNFGVFCTNVLVPAAPARHIEAQPADGPLLPAEPAHDIPAQALVCAPGAAVLAVGSDWIKEITPRKLKVFSNEVTNTDFVIAVAKNFLGIYSDIGDEIKILVRHQANYYPFIIQSKDGIKFSGYCY